MFAIATLRNIHLGVLMFPAACAVGLWLADMSLRDIVAGFPVNILVLLAGVTYLATSGDVSGWALISAMGVCASIVDSSPFSTTGALLVASAAEDERLRLKSLLTRWGLSMVLVGPAVAALGLFLLRRS